MLLNNFTVFQFLTYVTKLNFLFRIKERSHDDPMGNLSNSVTDGNGRYLHLKNIEIASVSCY